MSCERLTTRLAILDTFKHVPASFKIYRGSKMSPVVAIEKEPGY